MASIVAYSMGALLDGVGFALLRSPAAISVRVMTYLVSLHSLRGLLLTLLCAGLLGCAGAPVQEMSNARQAIKAARDAGAVRSEPQQMSTAEALLEQAETSLQKGDWRDARRNAVEARRNANEAMLKARAEYDDGVN